MTLQEILGLPQYNHGHVVKVEVCRLHHLGADHLLLPQPGPVHHVQTLHGGDMWKEPEVCQGLPGARAGGGQGEGQVGHGGHDADDQPHDAAGPQCGCHAVCLQNVPPPAVLQPPAVRRGWAVLTTACMRSSAGPPPPSPPGTKGAVGQAGQQQWGHEADTEGGDDHDDGRGVGVVVGCLVVVSHIIGD